MRLSMSSTVSSRAALTAGPRGNRETVGLPGSGLLWTQHAPRTAAQRPRAPGGQNDARHAESPPVALAAALRALMVTVALVASDAIVAKCGAGVSGRAHARRELERRISNYRPRRPRKKALERGA
jgi:hypothetical protein